MPIWTVRFCQLLPPPAAKVRRLQAIQLPHTPGAKREQAANVASSGWAGLEPGPREDVLSEKHSSQSSDRQWRNLYLLLLLFFFSGHLLWEAAGDSIPFLEMAAKHVDPSSSAFYVLAWHPPCSHAACTQSLAGSAWSGGKWCHLSKTGFPQP